MCVKQINISHRATVQLTRHEHISNYIYIVITCIYEIYLRDSAFFFYLKKHEIFMGNRPFSMDTPNELNRLAVCRASETARDFLCAVEYYIVVNGCDDGGLVTFLVGSLDQIRLPVTLCNGGTPNAYTF